MIFKFSNRFLKDLLFFFLVLSFALVKASHKLLCKWPSFTLEGVFLWSEARVYSREPFCLRAPDQIGSVFILVSVYRLFSIWFGYFLSLLCVLWDPDKSLDGEMFLNPAFCVRRWRDADRKHNTPNNYFTYTLYLSSSILSISLVLISGIPWLCFTKSWLLNLDQYWINILFCETLPGFCSSDRTNLSTVKMELHTLY